MIVSLQRQEIKEPEKLPYAPDLDVILDKGNQIRELFMPCP